MTIKDAESLTGLTAKSIRYYEKKGLLRVERDRQNDYRRYTQEDIDRLKSIRVLRYLGFGVDEIAPLLRGGQALTAALEERGRAMEREQDGVRLRQELCRGLAREVERGKRPLADCVRDYNESIDFLESEDGEALLGGLREWAAPGLPETILGSLILSGPILWLFIRIRGRQWDMLPFTAAASVVAAALLALLWVWYFHHRARHRDAVREKNRRNRLLLPLTVVVAVGGIAAFVGLSAALERLLAPADYLFYEFAPAAELGMILLAVGFVILTVAALLRQLGVKGAENLTVYADLLWGKRAVRRGVVAALAVGLYLCLTSVTFVTPTSIVRHDPFHPGGVAYGYEQVERIEAGFGGRMVTALEYRRKGQFFYRLRLDGRWVTFAVPTTNEAVERYAQDTYLELEELDWALTALGIPKTASEENWESCDLDRRYVERFLRIIRNVPGA